MEIKWRLFQDRELREADSGEGLREVLSREGEIEKESRTVRRWEASKEEAMVGRVWLLAPERRHHSSWYTGEERKHGGLRENPGREQETGRTSSVG